MSRTPMLRVTAQEMGFGSFDCDSRRLDWSEAKGENLDGWELQLPPITYGAIEQHAADLFTPGQAKIADKYPDRAAPEDLAEAFREADGFYEWEDGFSPMMSFVWPVMLPYGMSAEDVAARLNKYAPTISLVYFGEHSDHCPEEYGFGLSGGGMNLSDQIAAAYLCAHQVPPYSLLSGLSDVGRTWTIQKVAPSLRVAYAKAAELMRSRAARVVEEGRRVFRKEKKAA